MKELLKGDFVAVCRTYVCFSDSISTFEFSYSPLFVFADRSKQDAPLALDYCFRRYAQEKIQENVEAEIFQVVLDEMREHFGQAQVLELTSNSTDELEANLRTVAGKLGVE